MENASRALIMAGGVLIALLIIGAFILMFNNLTNYQDTGIQEEREAQIVNFNNQYETFNRDSVRGSDLYSLLNRVIDYNRRKSSEGVGEEGASIAFEPMKIVIDLNGKKDSFKTTGGRNLFETNGYEISGNRNTFEQPIIDKIKKIEDRYGKNECSALEAGMNSIFITDTDANKRDEARKKFNNICKKIQVDRFDELITPNAKVEGNIIRDDIYLYYSFVQFKRGIFKCDSVKYNNKTGRITEMTFKFEGKFN